MQSLCSILLRPLGGAAGVARGGVADTRLGVEVTIRADLATLGVLPTPCTFPLNARSFLTKIYPNTPFYTTYNLITF